MVHNKMTKEKRKKNTRYLLTFLCVLVCALLLIVPEADAASVKKSFRIELDQVQVVKAREKDGDRPYVVMIPFQSKVRKRGTTRVGLIEAEPHDWVSKRQYNRALRGRTHMKRGDRLRLPWWMSHAEFHNIDVLDSTRDGLPYVFGAVIVTLDNNNTPPHVVRSLLAQVKERLRRLLIFQLERGDLLRGVNLLDVRAIERKLREQVPALANGLVRDLSFNVLDWTFGSTFNPDKITGIQVYLWPSLKNVPSGSQEGTRSIAGEPFKWYAAWGPPPTVPAPLNFTARGSGAEYRFMGRIREIRPGTRAVNRVEIRLKTGADDLRRDNHVDIILHGSRSRRATLSNLTGNFGLVRYSDKAFLRNLPAGWRISDVNAIEIRTRPGKRGFGQSPDNWDLLGISVRLYGRGANEVRTITIDSPVHRFTNTRRRVTVSL
jgi:hypothetical protein